MGKSSLLQASIIPYLKAEQGENLAVVLLSYLVSEPIHQAIWLALQTEGLLADTANTKKAERGRRKSFVACLCAILWY